MIFSSILSLPVRDYKFFAMKSPECYLGNQTIEIQSPISSNSQVFGLILGAIMAAHSPQLKEKRFLPPSWVAAPQWLLTVPVNPF